MSTAIVTVPPVELNEVQETQFPPQWQTQYKLKMQGYSYCEIARRTGQDRTTVARHCGQIAAQAAGRLSERDSFNILCEELARLDQLEEDLQALACKATSDRAKAVYLEIKRKTLSQRAALMLSAGIIPRVPDQIFKVIKTYRPEGETDTGQRSNRTRDELINDVLEKMARTILLQ